MSYSFILQMNVSDPTIKKLESALANNQDVRTKLFDLLVSNPTQRDSPQSPPEATNKSNSTDEEEDTADSLPDPELITVEFTTHQVNWKLQFLKLNSSLFYTKSTRGKKKENWKNLGINK